MREPWAILQMSLSLDYASTPEAFCAALKRAREQRGIALAAIAASSKISESHLAALERGDLRHWPKGIFRRAFFRDYSKAIGLEAHYIDKFRRLFPEEGERGWGQGARVRGCEGAADPGDPALDEQGEGTGLRLVLDPTRAPPVTAWRRTLLSLIDAVILLALKMKVRLGAPRVLPGQPQVTATTERIPPMQDAWISEAKRIPDARPQLRVRMRVVR